MSTEDCMHQAKQCGIFAYCTEKTLRKICNSAKPVAYQKGFVIYNQGIPQREMLIIADGHVETTKTIDGQVHSISIAGSGNSVGANHSLSRDPAPATVRCVTPVTGYTVTSEALDDVLSSQEASREVIISLSKEIRRQATLLQTPLFQQHAKPTPIFAISVAAALESFYRSAMNSFLNARLTGQPVTNLFPNMGMQVPTRVLYINGFKGIRHFTEKQVDPEEFRNPEAVRLVSAVAPGIIMTPVSGLLEAFNAGNMNPEPIKTRWIRGTLPRGVREVIFGIGLNQLSDYFEERVTLSSSPALNNAIGSMLAGCVAGYFSHVPHNLSTMKLMNPRKPYYKHLADFIRHSEGRVPIAIPPSARFTVATILAVTFPRGLTIRTTQIVGSFIILNGTINSLKDVDVNPDRLLSYFK